MQIETNETDAFFLKYINDTTVLETIVTDHPYSALARLLLLNNYKTNNKNGFEKLAKQSALHFNNPYWFQYQLLQMGAENSEEGSNEILNGNKTDGVITDGNETGKDLLQNSSDALPVENTDSPEHINNAAENETDKEYVSDRLSENAETESQVNAEETEIPGLEQKDLQTEKETIPIKENERLYEKNIQNEETIESDGSNIETERIKEDENEIAASDSQTNFSEEILAFEPLHAVDYFASQGIKIKEEALLNDKLGKQMKSFTDWLKSMKKLHPGKMPEQNEVIEKIIQASAEQSNADAEILTEAMAEVLIKQNKNEKAIEMYQKLSLINPSKSAYFAAKIENINHK